MKKVLALLLVLVLLVGCGSASNNPEPLTDGTYTSTVSGHNGDVTIETTITDGQIEKVEVVEHEETDDIAGPAIEEITEAIVTEQSIGVDVVSGATVTSNAILEAVGDAINEAGGNADDFR